MNNFALPTNKGALERKLDDFYESKITHNRNSYMEKSHVSANYKGLLNQNSSGNLRYR